MIGSSVMGWSLGRKTNWIKGGTQLACGPVGEENQLLHNNETERLVE